MTAHEFCLKCASKGKSCCSHDTGGTFITIEEVARIAKLVGKSPEDVAMFVRDDDLKSEDDYLRYENLFFWEDGKVVPLVYRNHLLAVRRHGKDCMFLCREGCKLPQELKPGYCRLFPFWFRIENKEVKLFRMGGEDVCVLGEKLGDDMSVLEAINETEEALKRVARRLASEIKAYLGTAPELYRGRPVEEVLSSEKRKVYKLQKTKKA